MSELSDLIARRDALNAEIEVQQAAERKRLQDTWSDIYNTLYDMLHDTWQETRGSHLLTRKNDISFEFPRICVILENYFPDCIPAFMRVVLNDATVIEFSGPVPVRALTAFIKAMEE